MKKYFLRSICLILCLAFMAGCGQSASETSEKASDTLEISLPEDEIPEAIVASATPTGTPAETPTPTPMETPEVTEEPAEVLYYNPLSGLPVDSDISSARPYLVMCDNTYLAVPHAGVSKSDMLMEMMEEGGITRISAFYLDLSEVPVLGPIRSARPYNIYITLGYDAILVHAGGSKQARNQIVEFGLEDIDSITGKFDGYFYRDSSRSSENGEVHALMITGADAAAAARNAGYSLNHDESYDTTYGLVFDENAAEQCAESASSVVITYNGGKTSSFYYDDEMEAYRFYQFGGEYVDEDGSAVPMTNVIMIYANTYLQEDTGDGARLEIELTSGDGYFFTKGAGVHILWYKNGNYDVLHYTLDDGTPLKLTPGRTFVAVNQCGSYQGSVSFS